MLSGLNDALIMMDPTLASAHETFNARVSRV